MEDDKDPCPLKYILVSYETNDDNIKPNGTIKGTGFDSWHASYESELRHTTLND